MKLNSNLASNGEFLIFMDANCWRFNRDRQLVGDGPKQIPQVLQALIFFCYDLYINNYYSGISRRTGLRGRGHF